MRLPVACTLALALFGCSSTPSSNPSTNPSPNDAAVEDTPDPSGPDVTVTGFEATQVSFTGSDNRRVVDVEATFPEAGSYASIVLHLTLGCPSGKCDAWDRFGTFGIVTKKGDKPENDTVVELARYMTPYGVGGTWDFDVTDLRPLLKGKVTLRAFIDTWVGPGSPYGNGWTLTTTFDMVGGVPEREAIAVLPVWTMHAGAYGDPAKPLSTSFPPQKVAPPAGASSFALRTFVTGHGQGNLDNCAEFCPREHTLTVGGTPYAQKIWRTDCATTTVPGQKGTYKLSRAGWCPGADVRAWTLDVTPDVKGETTIAYDVAKYENTCRPDAATCAGCSLGTDCKYDGGNHTEPVYYVSTLLIAYK
jgi:hypothetical protein